MEITIVELMQSNLIVEDIPKENAAEIVSDTVSKLQTQERLSMRKKLKLISGTVVILLAQVLLFYVYFTYDIEPWWANMGIYILAFSGGQFCVRVWYHLVTGIPMPETKLSKSWKWWSFFVVFVIGLGLILVAAIHGDIGIVDQGTVFMAGMVFFAGGLIFMNIQEDPE